MWMSFIPKMTWCFPCFAEAGITYYQTLSFIYTFLEEMFHIQNDVEEPSTTTSCLKREKNICKDYFEPVLVCLHCSVNSCLYSLNSHFLTCQL